MHNRFASATQHMSNDVRDEVDKLHEQLATELAYQNERDKLQSDLIKALPRILLSNAMGLTQHVLATLFVANQLGWVAATVFGITWPLAIKWTWRVMGDLNTRADILRERYPRS